MVEPKEKQTKFIRTQFNEKIFEENGDSDFENLTQPTSEKLVRWLSVLGLGETKKIVKLGSRFNIHPLLLEDILNTECRPKVDIFEGEILLTFRRLHYEESSNQVTSEQVSVLLKEDWIFSFEEKANDQFSQIRGRLKHGTGKLRAMKSDYLAYTILDSVVDEYFEVMEKIGDSIEALEAETLKGHQKDFLKKLYHQKKQLKNLRRAIGPLREALEKILKCDCPLIKEDTKMYFKDIHDHIVQMMDTFMNYHESLNSIHEIHFTQVSMGMNEVMQVLTIIATLFIPLTFIVGVYGMNFEWMPELKLKYGYIGVWAIMIGITIALLLYFKNKKWF